MTTQHPSMYAGPATALPGRNHAMLAHDLRGALHGVLGGLAVLEAMAAPGEARAQVDRISASAKMLARLVSDLLGDGPAPERLEGQVWVEVPRFLRHIGRRWGGEAEERGLRFLIEPEPGVPARLRVGLTPLTRVLGNLIGNAFLHGRSGDVRLSVRPTSDGGAAFDLIDGGPGLPLPVIDRVLRPGVPAMGGSSDGHGLGLHIARYLCAEMGGSFSLGNRPGGGATASIAFPGALCEASVADAVSPPAGVAARLDLNGVRVLLAEDNPTNQMVATQMLRALNAQVTLATDGVETLERFEAAEFDLVVVDIEMPRLSGLDVIRAIRARPDARADVPIVALTAYVMREHRERIAAAGANGLISKPITSVEALGQSLRAYVPLRPSPGPAAATASADDAEPVADLAIFDALAEAIGEGMMAELLEKVVADLMQARADLAGALEPIEAGSIRSASHILISVAGAIGATRLQTCARLLNIAAHGEEGRGLAGDTLRCIDEIDAAVAFAESRRAAG